MIQFKKIGFQLQLILGLLVLIIIGGLGFAHFTTAKTSLFREFREKHLLAALKASQSSFQTILLRAIETSELLAGDPVLTSWFRGGEENEDLKTLSLIRLDYLHENFSYPTVFAANKITKNYWGDDYRLIDVLSENDPDDSWFFESIEKKSKTSLNFDSNRELNQKLLFINVLMGNELNPYGVAGVGIDISILTEEFEMYKISENSCFWLVDSVGIVKVSSRISEINRPLDVQLPSDVLTKMLQSDSVTVVSSAAAGKQKVELASMPVGTTKYRVVMLVPDDELFPVLGMIKHQTVVFSVVFFILTLLIVRLLSRRIITMPLLRLKKQNEHWANGFLDLDSDSHLLKRKDEIGSLAKSFEIMRRRLANNITELSKINEDLTIDKQQLKEVNEQLNRALDKASESERLTQSFLANISHEIRTPMNSIMGFSQLLRQPELKSEEQDYYVDIVLKSGSQLLSILDSIINLSKIESGVLKARWSRIRICALVNDTCDVYQLSAKEKGISLICEPCYINNHIDIVSDPALIQMVLNNLISNAIKFTDKGQVEVKCIRENGNVAIRVSDTGIGIAEKDVKVIFEPFRQVDALGTVKTNGAGLGLAIVDKIVHILGGKVNVETQPNVGSTFKVTLPENH